LKNLPPGSYRVSVSKGGYVDIAYGQLEKWKAHAARVRLADGEPKSLTLKLTQRLPEP
jgi:hypothetical protein